MSGRGHDEGRLCRCDRADGSCAGLAVRRLSQERVGELAEEIWTASSGDLLPARPVLDPRSSRAGASAQAAFVPRHTQERLWVTGGPRRGRVGQRPPARGAATGSLTRSGREVVLP
jgi:hypothetical protein